MLFGLRLDAGHPRPGGRPVPSAPWTPTADAGRRASTRPRSSTCARDALLRDSLLECDMLLADGQSVVWASRMLRQPLPERVAGIDLFESLLELRPPGGPVGLPARARKPEVLSRLLDVIEERWPGLRIAGARDGYFTDRAGGRGRRRDPVGRAGHAVPGDHLAEEGDLPRRRTATARGVPCCTASAAPSTSWPASPGARRSAGSGWAWSGRTAWSRSPPAVASATCAPTPASSVWSRGSASGRPTPTVTLCTPGVIHG